MIKSKLLIKNSLISHGFFNNKNGFSKGIYKTLNCGKGSKDNKFNIKRNLNYVKKKLGSQKNNISLLYQVHSSKFFLLRNFQKKD